MNPPISLNLKVKSTGPGSASAGDNVTLIGNLIGINADQIVGVQFSLGKWYERFRCRVTFWSSYNAHILASLLFCHSVLLYDNTFRFKLSVTENQTKFTL